MRDDDQFETAARQRPGQQGDDVGELVARGVEAEPEAQRATTGVVGAQADGARPRLPAIVVERGEQILVPVGGRTHHFVPRHPETRASLDGHGRRRHGARARLREHDGRAFAPPRAAAITRVREEQVELPARLGRRGDLRGHVVDVLLRCEHHARLTRRRISRLHGEQQAALREAGPTAERRAHEQPRAIPVGGGGAHGRRQILELLEIDEPPRPADARAGVRRSKATS